MADFDISKIKLIVGLGNSEREYIYTRHNAGFLFLDYISQSIFINLKKFKCFMSETEIKEHKLMLAKPTTMMNSSGESVTLLKSFYKLDNEQILIVHDDLDLKLGEYKLQFNKKPKVHNGINSVEEFIGGEFWSLRIGVDNRDPELRKNISGADYVLAKFSKEEIEDLKKTFNNIIREING